MCPFRNPEDTLKLADDFGENTLSFKEMHQKFLVETERKIDERWESIQKQKEQLCALRGRLHEAQRELDLAEQSRRNEDNQHGWSTFSTVSSLERQARENVKRLECEISRKEKAPPPLIMALPQSREIALQWLFFFYFDPILQQVAELAQRGQLCLLVEAPSSEFKSSLSRHLSRNFGTFPPTGEGEYILAWKAISTPARSENIDSYNGKYCEHD